MLSSLRSRIIFLTIVPTTLIYFGILFITLLRLEENAIDDVSREMYQYTQYYASYYASFLRETMQIANTSASFLQQNLKLNKHQLYAMVKKNVELNPLVFGSAIAFDYRHLSNQQLFFAPYAYRTRHGVKTINIAMVSDYTKAHWEWWNRVVKERKPLWTTPFLSKESDDALMATYAVPFYDQAELIGVTTVDVYLSPIEKSVSMLLPSDLEFFILTRKGQYLYDQNKSNILRRSIFDDAKKFHNTDMKALAHAMLSGKSGRFKLSGWKGSKDREWVFYRPIPNTEWFFGVRVKEESIISKSREDTILIGVILLASLLVLVLVIWFVIGKITAPLARLRENVREISAGKMDTVIEHDGKDEIAVLAKNFHQMRIELQKRDEDLRYARSRGFSRIVSYLGGKYVYFTQDLSGVLTYVSAEVESLLGYKRQDFIDNFKNYLSDNSINQRALKQNLLLFKGSQQDSMELEFISAKGKLHRFEVISVPVVDENDRIIAAEGMAHDITERHMEEEKFRVLFESSFEANLLFNEQHIIDCNHSFLQLFRFADKDNILMHSPCELCDEFQTNGMPSRQMMSDAITYARQHKSSKLAIEFKRSDGEIFPTEMSITSVYISDKLFFIGIIHDMTERLKVEQEIIAAKESAEKANKAKSEFLSNMSHELRTPLNGVLGYAQILLNQPEITDQQSQNLDAIESCGRHLLTLINDILDLSKIESGKMDVVETTFDLKRFLQDIYNIVSPKAHDKGLRVKLALDHCLPQYIKTDSTKLGQILVNLMGNAIKFTTAGEVCLKVEILPQKSALSQQYMRFSVIDTGVGIAKDKQREIFEAFKQVQAGQAIEGTGLGLAISKQLVEVMHYTPIKLESTPGKGSRFYFSMPLQKIDLSQVQEEDNIPEDKIPKLQSKHPVRALVVDDRQTNRDILSGMLGLAGFVVDTAEDGKKALDKARVQQYDVIFLDIQMPQLDGFQVAGQLRQQKNYQKGVFIAVTANALVDIEQKPQQQGFDDLIHKPIRSSELFAKLQHFFSFQWYTGSDKAMANTTMDNIADGITDQEQLFPDVTHSDLRQEEIQNYLQQIKKASSLGDIQRLQQLLHLDIADAVLGKRTKQHLIRLINHFEFDKIEAFITKIQEKHK